MKLIVVTIGCMILAAGLLLIGAACHQRIEGALSWLRRLPRRIHTRLVPDYGRHSGAVLLPDLYRCCAHCQDGSPCEPPDSHKEPCWDCDDVPVPAAQIEAQEHADAMHELAGPPSPEGEHPYPPHVPAWQPVEREHAEGDPFTGSQPILTDEVYEQMRAERPPTIEQLRQEYFRWKQPVYGEAPVLAVDEAQRLAEVITWAPTTPTTW